MTDKIMQRGTGLFRDVQIHVNARKRPDKALALLCESMSRTGWRDALAPVKATIDRHLASVTERRPPEGWRPHDDAEWYVEQLAEEWRCMEIAEAHTDVSLMARGAFQLGQLFAQLQVKIGAERDWRAGKASRKGGARGAEMHHGSRADREERKAEVRAMVAEEMMRMQARGIRKCKTLAVEAVAEQMGLSARTIANYLK